MIFAFYLSPLKLPLEADITLRETVRGISARLGRISPMVSHGLSAQLSSVEADEPTYLLISTVSSIFPFVSRLQVDSCVMDATKDITYM